MTTTLLPNDDQDVVAAEALALESWHVSRGARMVPFAGYSMPIQYEGIVAEHLWTRTHAGLFDVSHMGQLLITGEGVDEALETVMPVDLSSLKLGQLRYSLLLADDGGILDDLMLARWPGGIYIVVNGAVKYDDIAHLREQLPDAITINHLDDRALLALQGPRAFDVLARHTMGQWPLDALVFMTGGQFRIGEVDAWISRSGYTGEDGFEISIDASDAERVADLLCADADVAPIGLGARDSLRLEAGLPLYGHDLTPETDPVAAQLTFAIGKRRRLAGGYPGVDVIARALSDGPSTKRIGLLVEGRQPAREGAAIYAGDQRVGTVTSGGFSPSLQRPIAMGYIMTDYAGAGTPLTIDVRGKRLSATVTAMPFVPHRYHRKGAA